MTKRGTFIQYNRIRGEYLAEIRRIRALGPTHRDWRYMQTYREELVSIRWTNYTPSRRQRRYNLQDAAGVR